MDWTRRVPFTATSSGNLAQTASSGGGASAVVNLATAASTNAARFLTDIIWSYSTTPTGSPTLTVYDGTSSGAPILRVGLALADVGHLRVPLRSSVGSQMAVELTQAGSSIIGYLNAYAFAEAP